MRIILCAAALAAASLAPAANAGERPKPQQVSAISVDDRAVPASYRGPTVGHGYSARARRIADCLATYPNYDPKSDRVKVAPGVTRRCAL
ncbi:hypothetical protein [Phenylobacterium sp.]|jgi:hypothetical protein|uniref:hypothetical protein n=1 Tax=Phenylobacterium sp. TaxID=1871053 RepID=UPI002F95C95A